MFQSKNRIDVDERTNFLMTSGMAFASNVMMIALMADALYRGMNGKECWDLLGIIVIGGLSALAYVAKFRGFSRILYLVLGLSALLAVASAVLFNSHYLNLGR